MQDFQEILAIASSIGWGAADILRSYYRGNGDQSLNVQYKQEDPVTAADLAVNQYILQKLQTELGEANFGYISEETYEEGKTKQLNSELVWIIDPLDGTRDFIEKTGEYAIHMALVKENRPVLAVVVVPELEKLYHAIKGEGAFVTTRNGKSLPVKVSSRERIQDLTLVVSRSHRNQRLEYLLQNLPCQNQKSVGSVGCKIATIVEQQADMYISLSGKSAPKDWDMAAPELILTEAGGKFTHFAGHVLQYNTGDINQWGGLLASNGQFHESLCQRAENILVNWDNQNN
ncbi:3'(2'),5'-bisphosphate nucleotidase CysQ family protein [Calothrix rhizosoleniae]|uniref:3'(2'),5'-bisphosphate nucleotidase CysQ family protein n=1 Tax=Calothrix rhizosoleniae TaxID=888997 RepID=UPI000B4A556A|nr:inositol monophosphatase family protein [Calothrix rhizosoleniae]